MEETTTTREGRKKEGRSKVKEWHRDVETSRGETIVRLQLTDSGAAVDRQLTDIPHPWRGRKKKDSAGLTAFSPSFPMEGGGKEGRK